MPLSPHALALLCGVALAALVPGQAPAQAPARGGTAADPHVRPPTPGPGVMTVAQLEGLGVYDRAGEVIGYVRQVLLGPDGRALVVLTDDPAGGEVRRQSVHPVDRLGIHGNRLMLADVAAHALPVAPAGARPLSPERKVRVPFLREGTSEVAGLVEPRGGEEIATPVEILIADGAPEAQCRPPAARMPASDSFELRLVNRSGERAIVLAPRFFTAENLIVHQGVVPAAGDFGYVVRAGTVGRMIMRVPPGKYLLSCATVGNGDGPRSSVALTVVPAAR